MRSIDLTISCPVHDSFRVQQVLGMFNMPRREILSERFTVELPDLSDPWQVGVIVGPSGSGKTSIAREAFGPSVYAGGDWPADRAAIDCFGDLPIRNIVQTLTAVGFSSPPSWIKPYAVLSNGEKFRCELARALLRTSAEYPVLSAEWKGGEVRSLSTQHSELSTSPVVFDEFTSVVDRTVARIGSAAVARAIRSGRINKRFVAVTCHYDVVPWLDPDWVLDMATQRLSRGGKRTEDLGLRMKLKEERLAVSRCSIVTWPSRPCEMSGTSKCLGNNTNPTFHIAGTGETPVSQSSIEKEQEWRPSSPSTESSVRSPAGGIRLEIRRADRSEWAIFRRHHYLSGNLHPSAQCFIGEIAGRPAVFTAVLPFPHPIRPGWREHRTVCLPDFQGVGIGSAMAAYIASLYVATGRPYFSTSSHPAVIHHRASSPLWKMLRKPRMVSRVGASGAGKTQMGDTLSAGRFTAGFEYVGEGRAQPAYKMGVLKAIRTIRPGTAIDAGMSHF